MELKDIMALVNAGFTKQDILTVAQSMLHPAQPIQTPVAQAQPIQTPVAQAQPMQTPVAPARPVAPALPVDPAHPVAPAQPMQTPVQQAAQMPPSQQLDMTTLMQSLYQGTAQMDLPPAQHRSGQDILADRYADLMRASSTPENQKGA